MLKDSLRAPLNERAAAVGGPTPAIATPSLAGAFQQLDELITELEGIAKRVFERVQPFLEPAEPAKSEEDLANGQVRAAAPLAQSVFEYAERVNQVRMLLCEVVTRVAL